MAIAIILLTENPNLVNQVIRIHHLQTLLRQVRADVTAVLKLGLAVLLYYMSCFHSSLLQLLKYLH